MQADTTHTTWRRVWLQLQPRLEKLWLTRNLAPILTLGAITSGIVTYVTLTSSSSPFGADPNLILALLFINLIFLLALVAIVSRRIYSLWVALRKGSVGSLLQTRIVATFSLVTIIPTIIVSLFSAIFFNYGIQSWFNERVSTGLEESVAVAEAYLAEHRENIRDTAFAMASDLNKQLSTTVIITPSEINQLLSLQTNVRSLAEAIMFQHSQMGDRIIGRSRLSFSLAFEHLPPDIIERAKSEPVVVLTNEDEDKVRALIKLDSLPETYLLVGRFVDARVIDHMQNTQGSVNEYRKLRAQISHLQIEFFIMYILVAVLLLLAAIWYGMVFASRLITPIANLVSAAERVRAGDYSTRLEPGPEEDEIGTLARAFNRMTSQLESQRHELVGANRQLDERRRFTEAVLEGVSAGIIALDSKKCITLYNRTVAQLLNLPAEDSLGGKACHDLLPDIDAQLDEAEKNPDRMFQKHIALSQGAKTLTLNVRITVERFNDTIEGFIVTFDDITELLVAQRNAAWADVARRVAHEIKNPLTPIQLSAERLRKKYLKQIDASETENFTKYTDTITRHVGDIGRMVDEFVSFARMPTPVFKDEDVSALVRKSIFSEQTAHPDIQYHMDLPSVPMPVHCDERQISQALTNILKNAAEAIEGHSNEGGQIHVRVFDADHQRVIEIRDNGPGFPPDQIQQMLEPYVTTRSKGTGLGLSIVKKTMEDHKGSLKIENIPEGGSMVSLSFLNERDINAAL